MNRYLRNVTIRGGFGKPDLAFQPDGTLRSVELKIMNLRPGVWSNLVWEEVRRTVGIDASCHYARSDADRRVAELQV